MTLLTATVAQMVATGADDTVFDGGAGTKDKLSISTAAATLTDNHFTNVSNVEQFTTIWYRQHKRYSWW